MKSMLYRRIILTIVAILGVECVSGFSTTELVVRFNKDVLQMKPKVSRHECSSVLKAAPDNNNFQQNSSTVPSSLLEEMEKELNQLKRGLEVQRDTYEQQVHILEEQSKSQAHQAETALQKIIQEYSEYKKEMTARLHEIPSASIASQMERELTEMRQRTLSQEKQLEHAKIQLLTNREARKQLQGEMVALKHTFLTKLAEVEDALESEQDERVREQQAATQRLEQIERENKQKLEVTLENSKLREEKLKADFEEKLLLRTTEITDLEKNLQNLENAIKDREIRIAVMEKERNSLLRVTRNWLRLVRKKMNPFYTRDKKI